jgi:phosphoenolpyruvate carboxykinase (ATP)
MTSPDPKGNATTTVAVGHLDFGTFRSVSWNESDLILSSKAVHAGEGRRSRYGSFVADTGTHTGRSPKDKHIVRNAASQHTVWWENTASLSPDQFEVLKADFLAHAANTNIFVQDLLAGANPLYEMTVRVVTEKAWHALFMRNLLIHPIDSSADVKPQLTILNLPSFRADPQRHGTRSETVIAIDLAAGLVLIGGTDYAGEMKKAVFTVLSDLFCGGRIIHCPVELASEATYMAGYGTRYITTRNHAPDQQAGI